MLATIHEEIFGNIFDNIFNLAKINVLRKISTCIAFCRMKKFVRKKLIYLFIYFVEEQIITIIEH